MRTELVLRLVRFAAAGFVITLVDYAAFRALIGAGFAPDGSRAAAFVAAFIFSFCLHRLWTFGSGRPWGRDLLLYLPARLAAFALAQLAFLVAHRAAGLDADLAFLVQTPVQPVVNFLLGHRLVFPVARR
ncbi:MAG: GtrA family protein [Opitutales bacterium]